MTSNCSALGKTHDTRQQCLFSMSWIFIYRVNGMLPAVVKQCLGDCSQLKSSNDRKAWRLSEHADVYLSPSPFTIFRAIYQSRGDCTLSVLRYPKVGNLLIAHTLSRPQNI